MPDVGGFEVFLKFLPASATEDGVCKLFAGCGEIAGDVRLMRDTQSGQCKGVAWVSFATKSGAIAACARDGVVYDQRNVQITMAKQVTWAGGHAATIGGIAGTIQAVGTHTPAMGKEVVAAIVAQDRDGVFVDGTFGRGGHSGLILKALGPKGTLHAFDLDPEAVKVGKALEKEDKRFRIHYGGFKSMASILPEVGVALGTVAGVFLDLGISSPQLDEAARGFRPEQNGPLDLRFDLTKGPSASDFLREAPREELIRVLRAYGDPSDPHAAQRVADAVCLARRKGGPGAPKTTREFSDLVAACRGYEYQAMNSAKAIFQALRIHLNDEFGQLQGGVAASLDMLQLGGRVGVLTWKHSECALLVEYLRTVEVAPHSFPLMQWQKSRPADSGATKIPKKAGFVADPAQRPSAEELRLNSRSRSAVLHVFRKRQGLLCSDLESEAARTLGWEPAAGMGDSAPSSSSKKRKKSAVDVEEAAGGAQGAVEEEAGGGATAEESAPKGRKKKRQATECREEAQAADEEEDAAATSKTKQKKRQASEKVVDDLAATKGRPKPEVEAEAADEEEDAEATSRKNKKQREASEKVEDDVAAKKGRPKPEVKAEADVAWSNGGADSGDVGTIFEDEDLLVINKPAGMICHPSPGYWDHGTVVHALEGRLPKQMLEHRESYTGEADSFIPRAVVHRLDKGTTGVLLLAKSPAAEAHLTEQFKGRSMEKRYVALLLGHPGGDARAASVRVNAAIGRDPKRPGKMVVAADGKVAKSVVHVHAYDPSANVSLVSVELHTGRQHQIRVHCAHLGAAVANDDDYAGSADVAAFRKAFKKLPSKRPLLHCWSMKLAHPVRRDEELTVKAPLPPDMRRVIEQLWPDLPGKPEKWPQAKEWRVRLRGLPYSVEAQQVIDFLAPKLAVTQEMVRIPKKNKKLRTVKTGDVRPGEAEVFVLATAKAMEAVRELSGTELGGRWVEVSVEPAEAE